MKTNKYPEAAFDLDLFASKTSRNETNHFHIYVDDDGNYKEENGKFIADDLTDQEYGRLIHEYIHYIQHIQTLYGVNRTRLYNLLYIEYRKYLLSHTEVCLDLGIEEVAPQTIKLFERVIEKDGYQHYDYNIDEVEIRNEDIETARQNNQSVRIGIYDFESDNAWDGEKGYHFGYWAIIEGMAHNIQLLIDSTTNDRHFSVPYKVVDRICQKYYPEIYQDKKLLISICMIALTSDNPGAYFFEVADYANENKIYDGRYLYKEFLSHIIIFKGKKIFQKGMLRILQSELVSIMKNLVGGEIEYYNKVFEQTNEELSTGNSTLLNIIYEDRINDKNIFNDELIKVYGFPFIESHTSSLLQNNPKTNKPFAEIANLIYWELLYKRLINKESTKCKRYDTCRGSGKFTPECRDAQWMKEDDCLLSCGFKLFGKNVTSWQQKE